MLRNNYMYYAVYQITKIPLYVTHFQTFTHSTNRIIITTF